MAKPKLTPDLLTLHGRAIRIYKNLHRDCFSVMLRASGLVVLHTEALIVMNAVFTVRQGGRDRAVLNKRRNVHAFVDGLFDYHLNRFLPFIEPSSGREVTYNPFVAGYFRYRDTGAECKGAKYVVCSGGRAYVNPDDIEV